MRTLVIGYGNDLRSDDGAGRAVADRIAALDLPDVAVRSVIQLTPELSLEMAEVDQVVFVDASVAVSVTAVEPVVAEAVEPSAMSHYNTPGSLLGMTALVGAVPSHAYLVSIPVTDIGIGTELTPTTSAGISQAVAIITDLLTQ